MNDVERYNERIFENIKHVNEYGQEFWYARDLQKVLEYSEWRNFYKVIEKSKIACEIVINNVNDHFVDANKMVSIGFVTKREPENLPTPDKSIKKLKKSRINNLNMKEET